MTSIVLLPGLDGTGELFAPLVAAWGDRFRTQVVSYPRAERLGYAALADRVRALLPLHEDYVLLAESFSGPLGVMLAAERPQRLRGLVLCATFARSPLPLLRWMAPWRRQYRWLHCRIAYWPGGCWGLTPRLHC